MKIINSRDLSGTPLRQAAVQIAEAGLAAIDTQKAIRDHVRLGDGSLVVKNEAFPLADVAGIYVVGVGKCAIDAALALEAVLGERLTGGMVIDVRESSAPKKIKVFRGFHPWPNEANVDATKNLVNFLEARGENDLVICVISGGGSTLLCSPQDLSCQDEGLLLNLLMRRGVEIKKINAVRKHISFARGGHLAKYAYPATVVSLIFSDVIGNDLETVASGPTFRDTTTVAEAEKILTEHDALKSCGVDKCGLIETPKEEKYFEKVHNILLVNNEVALEAMRDAARSLGFAAEIRSRTLQGEAREAAGAIISDLRKSPDKSALLYGGETTVMVRGQGQGGRNQELALSGVPRIIEGELVVAINSDGRDNSDVAGAFCDTETGRKAHALGLTAEDFLKNNDSYNFFAQTGDRIVTGDTGSNVSDLVLAIKN